MILSKMKKQKNTKQKKEGFLSRFMKKHKQNKIAKPHTTSQIMRMFFKDFNENNSIIQLDENHYSVCFEYEDISFAKAKYIFKMGGVSSLI